MSKPEARRAAEEAAAAAEEAAETVRYAADRVKEALPDLGQPDAVQIGEPLTGYEDAGAEPPAPARATDSTNQYGVGDGGL